MLRIVSAYLFALYVIGSVDGATFDGPVASSDGAVRYAWKSAVSADGKTIATCYGHWEEQGRVTLFDTTTGKERKRISFGKGLRALVAAPGGKEFIAGDFGGTYYVMDFASGAILRTWRNPKGSVEGMDFSRSGKYLAAGSNGDFAVVWEYETAKPISSVEVHEAIVYSVSISPQEDCVASCDVDGVIMISDLQTGHVKHRMQHRDEERDRNTTVSQMQWSNDGTRLYSAGVDGLIYCWDTNTGKRILTNNEPAGRLDTLVKSADGKTLFGIADGQLARWNASDINSIGYENQSPDDQHQSIAMGLSWVDESTLISSSWDNTCKLWDAKSGQCKQTFAPETSGKVIGICETQQPNGKPDAFLTVTESGFVQLVDANNLTSIAKQPLKTGNQRVDQISHFASRANQFVVRTATGEFFAGTLAGDELTENVRKLTLPSNFPNSILGISLVEGSQLLVCHDRCVTKFKLDNDTLEDLDSIDVSSDGDFVVADGAIDPSGTRALFRSANGQIRAYALNFDGDPKSEALSSPPLYLPTSRSQFISFADPETIVAGYGSNSYLLNLEPDVERPFASIRAGSLTSIGLLDGGRTLVTGSSDSALRRFDKVIEPIEPIATQSVSEKQIRVLSFSADSKTLWAVTIGSELFQLDTKTLQPKKDMQKIVGSGVARGGVLPDLSGVLLTDFGGRLYPFSLPDWKLGSVVPAHNTELYHIEVSPKGDRCVLGGHDGTLIMLDFVTGNPAWKTKPVDMPITCVSWSPDLTKLVICTGDWRDYQKPGSVCLVNAENGEIIKRFKDHTVKIQNVKFHPNGKHFTSVSDRVLTYNMKDLDKSPIETRTSSGGGDRLVHLDDGTSVVAMYGGAIEVYDLLRSKKIKRFAGHPRKKDPPNFGAIVVSPDGKLLATGDMDGRIFVWPLK